MQPFLVAAVIVPFVVVLPFAVALAHLVLAATVRLMLALSVYFLRITAVLHCLLIPFQLASIRLALLILLIVC